MSSAESKALNLRTDIVCNLELVKKIRTSKIYAQNLYAALCNNEFKKIGYSESWGCSWRTAGHIIADIREDGTSYLDWYCSGTNTPLPSLYVCERTITNEIADDLLKIGWHASRDE